MREVRWTWLSAAAVIGLLGVLYAYRGGETLMFLFVLASLLILLGILFSLLGPKHIQASRSWMPHHPQAGEPCKVEITLEVTGGIWPLSLRIKDTWAAAQVGERRTAVMLTGEDEIACGNWGRIGHSRTFACNYMLEPELRGNYEAKELTVSWSDPFGWFQRTKRAAVNDMHMLVVHPAPLPLSTGNDCYPRSRWEGQSAAGRFLPIPMEEADGLRAYAPGDPLKWVQWKNSAKRGELLTRISLEQTADARCLLLDTAMDSYGRLNKEKGVKAAFLPAFELAVSTAAAILRRELDSRGHGTAQVSGHAAQLWFLHDGPADRRSLEKGRLSGSKGLLSGLNALSGISPGKGASASAASLLSALPDNLKGQHIILITGRCTDALTDAALLAAPRTGHLDILLAAGSGDSASEASNIERLRAAGIRVIKLSVNSAHSQPPGAKALHELPSEGGGGHVSA